jgi:uncharacterized protein
MYVKWEQVLRQLKSIDSAIIAFSGGLDSTLLLQGAAQAQTKVLAVTARADIFPQSELVHAEQTALRFGVPHMFADFNILNCTEFTSNPGNRCYVCKKRLIGLLKEIARVNHFHFIIDGTNASDLTDYRPGLKALQEEKIVSPLKEARLTKREILLLAEEFGLPAVPDNACLASRIPYGQPITSQKLEMIEKAESLLHSLGFKLCRVRYEGDTARIEVPERDFEKIMIKKNREAILSGFESVGFLFTALELHGYASGSLNKLLKRGAYSHAGKPFKGPSQQVEKQ